MVNGSETFKEIIHGDTPVLVDFYADWCGPCKMMAPVIEEFSREMGDKVRVLKVDIDRNPRAAEAYRILGVPTMILFRKGNVLWREAGVVPGHVLKQVIGPHLQA
jgi:thioredoxin 1